jgi:GT2 family glycosyltransferase
MRLSVVIVNWNSAEDLRACLDSLYRQTHSDLEIVVVDNGSTDGSAAMVSRDFTDCKLVALRENLGFAEGCNRGIAESRGEWIATLNNDAVADADWAKALVEAALSAPPTCGMLQSLLLFSARPDTINSTGIVLTFSGGGRDRDGGRPLPPHHVSQEIFCPTAGAAAYRRSMLEAIQLPSGYFDGTYFLYYEDMDLGWRARLAGWTALYVPRSRVLHRYHGSSDRHDRSWLGRLASMNRLRTLLKNASVPFLLKTSPRTVKEAAALSFSHRDRALRELADAIEYGVATRRHVTAMSTVSRESLEQRFATSLADEYAEWRRLKGARSK